MPHLLLVLGVLVKALVDLVGMVMQIVRREVPRPGSLEQLVDGVRRPVPLGVRLQQPPPQRRVLAHNTDAQQRVERQESRRRRTKRIRSSSTTSSDAAYSAGVFLVR